MTVQLEHHFICDRCGAEAWAAANLRPGEARAGLEGWQVLAVGTDPGMPLKHLCPPCAEDFGRFLEEEK